MEKTRLEKLKEECDKANALSYCEHSDGVFVTLLVSLIGSFLIVVFVTGGIQPYILPAFGIGGLIFLFLGSGFFMNRYVLWRRIAAARNYHDEKERLIRQGQQVNHES